MSIILPLAIIAGVTAWVLRPRSGMSNFRKVAMLAVIALVLVIAIAAMVLQLLYNAAGNVGVAEASNTCFVITFGLLVATVVASIGYAILRQGEIAKGLGFAACISVFVVAVELGLLEWLGGV